LIVNSVVKAYVSYESAHRKMTAAETLAILQREKEKRDAEVSAEMKTLVDFKKANGAVSFDTDKGNVITQRLNRISDELTAAQLQSMDLKARYDALLQVVGPQAVKEQAKTDSPAATAAAEVSRANNATWLRTELCRAEVNLESLA